MLLTDLLQSNTLLTLFFVTAYLFRPESFAWVIVQHAPGAFARFCDAVYSFSLILADGKLTTASCLILTSTIIFMHKYGVWSSPLSSLLAIPGPKSTQEEVDQRLPTPMKSNKSKAARKGSRKRMGSLGRVNQKSKSKSMASGNKPSLLLDSRSPQTEAPEKENHIDMQRDIAGLKLDDGDFEQSQGSVESLRSMKYQDLDKSPAVSVSDCFKSPNSCEEDFSDPTKTNSTNQSEVDVCTMERNRAETVSSGSCERANTRTPLKVNAKIINAKGDATIESSTRPCTKSAKASSNDRKNSYPFPISNQLEEDQDETFGPENHYCQDQKAEQIVALRFNDWPQPQLKGSHKISLEKKETEEESTKLNCVDNNKESTNHKFGWKRVIAKGRNDSNKNNRMDHRIENGDSTNCNLHSRGTDQTYRSYALSAQHDSLAQKRPYMSSLPETVIDSSCTETLNLCHSVTGKKKGSSLTKNHVSLRPLQPTKERPVRKKKTSSGDKSTLEGKDRVRKMVAHTAPATSWRRHDHNLPCDSARNSHVYTREEKQESIKAWSSRSNDPSAAQAKLKNQEEQMHHDNYRLESQSPSSGDLQGFLRRLDLEDYLDKFQAERLDLETLHMLNVQDLDRLGLPLGPKKRFEMELSAFRSQQNWQISRLPSEIKNDEPVHRNKFTSVSFDSKQDLRADSPAFTPSSTLSSAHPPGYRHSTPFHQQHSPSVPEHLPVAIAMRDTRNSTEFDSMQHGNRYQNAAQLFTNSGPRVSPSYPTLYQPPLAIPVNGLSSQTLDQSSTSMYYPHQKDQQYFYHHHQHAATHAQSHFTPMLPRTKQEVELDLSRIASQMSNSVLDFD